MTLTEQRLTDKQEAFCAWYITLKNATQAALKAGYDGDNDTLKSIGCENLTKPYIQARLQTIADSTYTGKQAIASMDERKAVLSEILRSKTELPIHAGHRVMATRELNEMEKVGGHAAPMVAIQVVLPSAQSAQSLPEPAKTLEIEAKSGDITAIVRTSEAITRAKRLLKGHRWTAEEKAELLREVFGDDEEINDVKINSDPA